MDNSPESLTPKEGAYHQRIRHQTALSPGSEEVEIFVLFSYTAGKLQRAPWQQHQRYEHRNGRLTNRLVLAIFFF